MKYTGYYSMVNVDDDVIMNRPQEPNLSVDLVPLSSWCPSFQFAF